MALSSVIFHLSYKFRLLLLFSLCMMVVAWATSSYLVDTMLETPKAKSLVENFRKATTLEKENQKKKAMTTVEVHTVKFTMSHCPALSPYLQGPSKLKFKASLTLEEVQKENPQVAKGRHRPAECSALQRVAILIPHRNREKHLLYLLEHLHPFLQRQQLDYGIYVIHQAGNTKFNRAKLLNVGYLEAMKEENWDCFIFHDVDLVPENDLNMYTCDNQPKHLVVGRNNTGYRVEMQKMRVMRPSPDVGKYTMIFHTRDRGNEANGERMKLLRQVSRVWKTDGLNSCSYKLLSVEHNPLYINVTVDFSMPPKIS
ncbi:beta-1,4-galactosyltransferase 4 isoform X2 [Gopherus flavomarginatus]|uniref:beta-1,4-galactosyltransferase 4 isoform X2 n=1 Tax=Gopherus flavomarginatus TaxID=286002 RepID=UPI0021CBB652|nr:beta-1,4-galactosyltransferase 4 isoform X2 [Gopherus flavomarginatus]